MNINSINDFLYSPAKIFNRKEFNFELELNPNNIGNVVEIQFTDCVFYRKIHFHHITSSELEITFINCKFHDEIDISINHVKNLSIVWHFQNNEFSKGPVITHSEDVKINISSNTFGGRCKIYGLFQNSGRFTFIENIFTKEPKEIIPKRETGHEVCIISNCQLINPSFNNNTYYMPFTFFNNVLKYDASYSGHYFNNNIFHKVEFINTDFGNNCTFIRCDFLGTALFNKTLNNNSDVLFSSCKFISYTHFGEAEISLLNIEYCTFQKPVSFQKALFNEINLSEVKFEKGAYFDDIEISKIKNPNYFNKLSVEKLQEWKHTLRLIKQELQKSDNKIDYNRFRVYEFNAYREELKKEAQKLRSSITFKERLFMKNNHYAKLKRDWVVLKLSHSVSDYGTDWEKALKFTLLFGLALYIPFFIFDNWDKDLDLTNWQVFPIGFLRFFILTDFYSPLKDGKTYIEMNGWNHLVSWLIFIFGKIVIAFGIYEMIQAFRKFKA